MKIGLTEIICILDKSGSMAGKENDVIGGFNTFITSQKALSGEAKVTLTIFDTVYEILYSGKDIKEVPELTTKDYFTSGCTALLDAVGKTIDEVGKRLNNTPENEKPEKVIVIIMTDGQENSSREYKKEQIKTKVQHQTDTYKWQFIYMGANVDRFDEAGGLGMSVNMATSYSNTARGIKDAYLHIGECVMSYRTGNDISMSGKDLTKDSTGEEV